VQKARVVTRVRLPDPSDRSLCVRADRAAREILVGVRALPQPESASLRSGRIVPPPTVRTGPLPIVRIDRVPIEPRRSVLPRLNAVTRCLQLADKRPHRIPRRARLLQ